VTPYLFFTIYALAAYCIVWQVCRRFLIATGRTKDTQNEILNTLMGFIILFAPMFALLLPVVSISYWVGYALASEVYKEPKGGAP
jgi:hypothetical protein